MYVAGLGLIIIYRVICTSRELGVDGTESNLLVLESPVILYYLASFCFVSCLEHCRLLHDN